MITVYGTGCIYFLLIGSYATDLTGYFDVCTWMVIVAVLLVPFTWFGTPQDAWHLALVSVVTAVSTEALIIYETVQVKNSGDMEACSQSKNL